MDDNGYLEGVGVGQVAQQPEELVDCLFLCASALISTWKERRLRPLARGMSFVLHLPNFLVINPPNLPTMTTHGVDQWSDLFIQENRNCVYNLQNENKSKIIADSGLCLICSCR